MFFFFFFSRFFFLPQSDDVKLQLLTLSAKLLLLSHLSTLTNHLRTLSLLFDYLTALARYDLTYEVRDRARYLKGLLSSAGVGIVKEGTDTRMRLSDEDFAKGVQVEDLVEEKHGENLEDERTMTVEQVRVILFDGKDELSCNNSGKSSSLPAIHLQCCT